MGGGEVVMQCLGHMSQISRVSFLIVVTHNQVITLRYQSGGHWISD